MSRTNLLYFFDLYTYTYLTFYLNFPLSNSNWFPRVYKKEVKVSTWQVVCIVLMKSGFEEWGEFECGVGNNE